MELPKTMVIMEEKFFQKTTIIAVNVKFLLI